MTLSKNLLKKSAISLLSVDKRILSKLLENKAASIVQATNGFPWNIRLFLPGSRFEPPLANMIAMLVITKYSSHHQPLK